MQVVFHGVVLSITKSKCFIDGRFEKKKRKKTLPSFPSHTLFVFTIAVSSYLPLDENK